MTGMPGIASVGVIQSQMQAQYAQAQAQQQQLLMQAQFNAFSAQQNVADLYQAIPVASTPPKPDRSYFRIRAEHYTAVGERIVDRISFWRAFMPLSAPLLSKLADDLNAASSEAERFLEMATQ